MRIAFLVLLYPPKWLGGTELSTLNLAKNLSRRGHEIHILTTAEHNLLEDEISENIHIHRIKCIKKRFLWTLIFGISAQGYLRQIHPDIVQAQGAGMGFVGLLGKLLFHFPYIVWCQGSDIYIQDSFKKVITRLILSYADRVIALTDNMRSACIRIYSREISVISVGINEVQILHPEGDDFREQPYIFGDKKIILFGGNLRPVKRVKDLITAMSRISILLPEAYLLVAGDGDERENLEKMVEKLGLKDYVKFLGRVSNDDMLRIMAFSHVFVLPSESEGFPVTILEAMASGLPIITTNIPGMNEIVSDGINGYLIPPKNPEKLAERIFCLLKSDELRFRQSEANREKASHYTWDKISDRFEKEYLNLIDN